MGEINSKTKYYIQNENGDWIELIKIKSISQLEEEQVNYEEVKNNER